MVVFVVDVVEDRAEGGEGEWWVIGWDGWGVRVVIGGGVGRVGGGEKWRAREGLVYVTLSGRVGVYVFVVGGPWE